MDQPVSSATDQLTEMNRKKVLHTQQWLALAYRCCEWCGANTQ